MRKKIVAGNWKMNMTPSQAVLLAEELCEAVSGSDKEVIFCVPAIDIVPVAAVAYESDVMVGAENMYFEEKGAYTGEISAAMLKDAGAGCVILGHSERRQLFGETDEDVNKKVKKAFEHQLMPIMCCGETLEQRKNGCALNHIRNQVEQGLKGISADQVRMAVIAYEPIWAIGTGETATKEQAEEVCAAIREHIERLYDSETAEAIRILYGGSVNAKNAAELFAMPDIDGGLVGGASLKPEFADIVNC